MLTRNKILMRKEYAENKAKEQNVSNLTPKEEPGELVLFMASAEDRKASNVRWSSQRDIFRTGNYPHLNWNLYDCHPDVDKTQPVAPDLLFREIKDLGHGSFGKVKLVELKLTGERLAMKVMDKEECPKALRTKELFAFIQMGTSPFIVRFHSCFQTEMACYLLMQYHCGGSLAKIIEDYGPLCENTARFFTAEVVEGLLHLHSRGIIHRDIKLANVLLGVDNHVRICDMGLCKLGMSGKAKTHTRCGALRYCAPEVLAREWYSKEVDWWSLGVVLFRMLTGQYPFDAENRQSIEELIKTGEPNMKNMADGKAKDIIKQFLQKKPEERLGFGENAAANIRTHPFFQEIKWEQVQSRQAKAPSVQKRFMRRGSILRRLAFGSNTHEGSRMNMLINRLLRLLALILLTIAVTCLAIVVARPSVRERVRSVGNRVLKPIGEGVDALWAAVHRQKRITDG